MFKDKLSLKVKPWLYLLMGCLMSGVSILIFTILLEHEHQHIHQLIKLKTIEINREIQNQIETRIAGLNRMAKRWEVRQGTPKHEWEEDAKAYIRDYKGYQAIEWVSSNYYVNWVVPQKGNKSILNVYLAFEPKRKKALETAKNKGKPTLTKTINLVQGGKGFLNYHPLFINNKFDGFIVGVFKVNLLIDSILKQEDIEGYRMAIYDNSEVIYQTIPGKWQSNDWAQRATMKLDNLNWQIEVIPEPELIQSLRSPLPYIILMGSLIISWLLALTIYLLQKNRRKAKILELEIIERQRIESDLYDSMTLQKAILDSANYTIISTTIDGIITTFNQGSEKMLGYSAAEVIGKVTPAIIHDLQEVIEAAENLSQELEIALEPGFDVFVTKTKLGQKNERIWTYIRKDGSRFPVLLSITALRDQQGEITGFLGIGSDMTERLAMEQALQKTLQELEKEKIAAESANRAKSEFLANMSHEIRTPMNAILGFSDLLKDIVTEPEAQEYLEIIAMSGKTLLSLINDILDLSRIEAGRVEIYQEPVNLRFLVEEILQIFLYKTEEKSLKMTSKINNDLPLKILFDEIRLRQILLNIVGNAVKFTEQGLIQITVNCCPSYPEQFEQIDLTIMVEDTGIGIAPTQQEKIFDVFTQSNGQNNRKYGGTGLGLAITKRLVQIMGGTINLESELGKGSKFKIYFPNVNVFQELRINQLDKEIEQFETSNMKMLKIPISQLPPVDVTPSPTINNPIDLPELIDKLRQESSNTLPKLRNTMIISDIESFIERLNILAQEHHCQLLLEYSDTLRQQVNDFDWEQIPQTIEHFVVIQQSLEILINNETNN